MYSTLKDAWPGPPSYLEPCGTAPGTESYTAPVTMPLHEWRKYVASGKHILQGDGGVIPGRTMQVSGGVGTGVVHGGHVRQGYGGGW